MKPSDILYKMRGIVNKNGYMIQLDSMYRSLGSPFVHNPTSKTSKTKDLLKLQLYKLTGNPVTPLTHQQYINIARDIVALLATAYPGVELIRDKVHSSKSYSDIIPGYTISVSVPIDGLGLIVDPRLTKYLKDDAASVLKHAKTAKLSVEQYLEKLQIELFTSKL